MTAQVRDLQERFAEALAKEQSLRPTREHCIDGEVAWVRAERELMLSLVNAERAKLGYTPVDMADIHEAELGAAGHTDYSTKFALYCASLVFKEDQ